jgi:hypothetical protein
MALPAATVEGWLVPLAETPWAAGRAGWDGCGAPDAWADATELGEAESLACAWTELCPSEIAVNRAGVHIAIKTLFMKLFLLF